ncbi:hypothetical protein [Pectobacterium zantedeschiae]|uniref:hypothetical protein n=1 Tax=Pectobacterium zantedeschiae TaxID=2034769 RepID=UPI0013EB5782|nr:hypothetical protein [Pectobacterium zantedeschiae]
MGANANGRTHPVQGLQSDNTLPITHWHVASMVSAITTSHVNRTIGMSSEKE